MVVVLVLFLLWLLLVLRLVLLLLLMLIDEEVVMPKYSTTNALRAQNCDLRASIATAINSLTFSLPIKK